MIFESQATQIVVKWIIRRKTFAGWKYSQMKSLFDLVIYDKRLPDKSAPIKGYNKWLLCTMSFKFFTTIVINDMILAGAF